MAWAQECGKKCWGMYGCRGAGRLYFSKGSSAGIRGPEFGYRDLQPYLLREDLIRKKRALRMEEVFLSWDGGTKVRKIGI